MKIRKNSSGFTLIEVIVVAGLMVFIASVLIRNFSGSRFNFDNVAYQVQADLRLAESHSQGFIKYNNTFRCGYGLTWINNTTYAIYTGRNATTSNCSSSNYSYSSAATTPRIKLSPVDARVDILSFTDVFFLPPDPRIYYGTSLIQATSTSLITLRKKTSTSCSTNNDCRFVCIYPSGRIEVYKSSSLCI